MPLSPTASLEEIREYYAANCAYDLNGSVEQAYAFIEACRGLIDLADTSTSTSAAGAETTTINTIKYNEQIKAAQAWIERQQLQQSTGRVRHASFGRYRD